MTTIIEDLDQKGHSEVDRYMHATQRLDELPALPDEKYPRVREVRSPDQGYYVALGLIMAVWMVTPLSW